MATPVEMPAENERELVLARRLAAPTQALYRCWTDPELIPKWFAPAPFTTEVLEMDLRPGGTQKLVMRDAEGNPYPTAGVYLEVVPNRKLSFTDAFTAGWKPSEKPFMAAEITFEDLGNGETLYVARARHWSVEDTQAHIQMGFHEGWGLCAAQLEALAQTL